MAAVDVTDATFQTDVIERSMEVPVVLDLWAEWCGPCRTLGPILERVIDETGGKVALAKVDVDSNPMIFQAFQERFNVRGIPAVFAFSNGAAVDSFIGAHPEAAVRDFVTHLLPTEEQQAVSQLLAAGDEGSLRIALGIEPGNEDVIVKLGELLVAEGRGEEALQLLARIPESERTRKVAAAARVGTTPDDDYDAQLTALLDRVKSDEEARQTFVDLLELMGPADPRTADYRRRLTARLY